MKKRIGSKFYDTDSAELIATTDNGKSEQDPAYASVSLYRKKTSEFFLFIYEGEGFEKNMFFGKSDGAKEYIKPISDDAAIQWLNDTQGEGAVDLINQITEEPAKKRIEFYVETEVKKGLDKFAEQKGITLSELRRIAINEYIENNYWL